MNRALLAVGLGLAILDQVLKYILTRQGPALVMINPGTAFGWGSWIGLIFGLILLIFVWVLDNKRPLDVWLILLAAVASNVVDRLRIGGVIDYLSFGSIHLNLADIVICLAIIYLFWLNLIKKDAR